MEIWTICEVDSFHLENCEMRTLLQEKNKEQDRESQGKSDIQWAVWGEKG